MALVHEKVVEGMKKAAEVLPKVAPIASALLGSNNIVHAAANVLAVPFVAHTIAEKAADTLKSKVGRLPLAASVGAPFFTTWANVQARADRMNKGIDALAQDIRNNLVYRDPARLRSDADALDATGFESLKLVAKDLRVQADEVDKRIAAQSKEQSDKELAYSQNFSNYKQTWNVFRDQINDCSSVPYESGYYTCFFDAPWRGWEQEDQYETDYFKFVEGFKALGKSPTIALSTPQDIAAQHPDTNPVSKTIDSLTSFVKTAAVLAGVVGAGYIGYQIVSRPRSGSAYASKV